MDMSIFKKFEVRYSKGDMIFCEFEPGNEFFLIQTRLCKGCKSN